jgi:hypothetical protein
MEPSAVYPRIVIKRTQNLVRLFYCVVVSIRVTAKFGVGTLIEKILVFAIEYLCKSLKAHALARFLRRLLRRFLATGKAIGNYDGNNRCSQRFPGDSHRTPLQTIV